VNNNNFESFIRWQAITRDQLSSVTSLVLGLATGMLAFNSSLLLESKFSCLVSFYCGLAATLFFMLSISLALCCAVTRLHDFRITTQIAKYPVSGNASENRNAVSSLGKTSWRLFWAQLWCFGLGGLSETLAITFQIFHY
jgi:fumarate reductase subunit D